VIDRSIFLLIRHGEAEGNAERRFIGQTPVPLSELGERQASAVADRLASWPITRIISSDIPRALQTAEYLARATGLAVETEPGLREIANGEWSGLLPGQIAERWPDLWARYRAGEDVQRPGGERWADVGRRAVAAIDRIAGDTAPGEMIGVFSHGGPIMQILRWAVGRSPENHLYTGPFAALANTSISAVALPDPRVLGVNDIGHLDGLVRHPQLPFLG
jgi:probable phosphoglycerate mutase